MPPPRRHRGGADRGSAGRAGRPRRPGAHRRDLAHRTVTSRRPVKTSLEVREGWFVLVRGAAHHLDTEAERAPYIDAGLEPWIPGVPAHFIRVNPTSIWC